MKRSVMNPLFKWGLAALLTCALLGCSGAYAQVACSCGEAPCACFLQRGDEGIAVRGVIALLHEQGYLSSGKGSAYDADVETAVKAFQAACGLDETGTLDDDTLTFLVFGRSAAELDAREGGGNEVWVPTNGGKKRHKTAACSGMEDPRKMSSRNAQALGIDACGRCKPM